MIWYHLIYDFNHQSNSKVQRRDLQTIHSEQQTSPQYNLSPPKSLRSYHAWIQRTPSIVCYSVKKFILILSSSRASRIRYGQEASAGSQDSRIVCRHHPLEQVSQWILSFLDQIGTLFIVGQRHTPIDIHVNMDNPWLILASSGWFW